MQLKENSSIGVCCKTDIIPDLDFADNDGITIFWYCDNCKRSMRCNINRLALLKFMIYYTPTGKKCLIQSVLDPADRVNK